MREYFSAGFFAGNRRRLKELFTGSAPIVLTANGSLQRNGDSTYLFRQDSSFWYLTGIDDPDIVLVMDKDKEYLIVPEGNEIRDVFEGEINQARLSEISGIKSVIDSKNGWKQLANRLSRVKHMATLAAPPAYEPHYNMYTNPARALLIARCKDISPGLELLDLRSHLAKMRVVKQPEELVALREAVDITVKTIKTIAQKRNKFNYEYEIEAEITREFRRRGAAGHAYNPMVATGVNACTLHYFSNNDKLPGKGLLFLDVGAEVKNYAADISRTYALGKATRRQQKIHAAVLEVQDFALARLTAGTIIGDYEKEVEQFMGEKLRALGLIKSITRENVRRYYPHATSHFLGLDAHDSGNYREPLKPNCVVTVEPGIYVPEEGIGIRIEDDVLITEDGNEVMSSNLPRSID